MLTSIVSACASSGGIDIDPNETRLTGRIATKAKMNEREAKERMDKARNTSMARTVLVNAITLPAGFIMIPIRGGSQSSGEQLLYEVNLETGQRVAVISAHEGFDVGDCVTVFLSQESERYPPRMAYSMVDCKN